MTPNPESKVKPTMTPQLAKIFRTRGVTQRDYFREKKQKVIYEGKLGETNFQKLLGQCKVEMAPADPGTGLVGRIFGTGLNTSKLTESTSKNTLPPPKSAETGAYSGAAFRQFRELRKSSGTQQFKAFTNVARQANWKNA